MQGFASALNRIIHNSHFRRRISLEEQEAQKEDRFLRGRQIAYLIYEYFQVTGANDSVENYADLFTIGLRNDEPRQGVNRKALEAWEVVQRKVCGSCAIMTWKETERTSSLNVIKEVNLRSHTS